MGKKSLTLEIVGTPNKEPELEKALTINNLGILDLGGNSRKQTELEIEGSRPENRRLGTLDNCTEKKPKLEKGSHNNLSILTLEIAGSRAANRRSGTLNNCTEKGKRLSQSTTSALQEVLKGDLTLKQFNQDKFEFTFKVKQVKFEIEA